ncbi:hypothetical protein E3N88_22658 [Mikania micrantha]|uniref:Uncharacterized protein n=1 Tax=Mikania micrantha TaxID=192012 RepID=A0A5N6NCQ7_9ASTR|nr:hypothetical protein E3N88_22658 [Mikania micrantha]
MTASHDLVDHIDTVRYLIPINEKRGVVLFVVVVKAEEVSPEVVAEVEVAERAMVVVVGVVAAVAVAVAVVAELETEEAENLADSNQQININDNIWDYVGIKMESSKWVELICTQILNLKVASTDLLEEETRTGIWGDWVMDLHDGEEGRWISPEKNENRWLSGWMKVTAKMVRWKLDMIIISIRQYGLTLHLNLFSLFLNRDFTNSL